MNSQPTQAERLMNVESAVREIAAILAEREIEAQVFHGVLTAIIRVAGHDPATVRAALDEQEKQTAHKLAVATSESQISDHDRIWGELLAAMGLDQEQKVAPIAPNVPHGE